MSTSTTAVGLVCDILASRQERFAWKTAKYLSRQLRTQGCEIDAEALDTALVKYAGSPGAALRYSAFPARKNLDTLWGHKSLVGQLAFLPNLTLDEEHQLFGPCDVPDTAPWCFLSHNHRDLETVWEIRRRLLDRGYGVWAFEAEISLHAPIGKAVQEGLERSDRFLIYASRYALQSRWSIKEMLTALRGDLEPYVIVPSADPELIEFFTSWLTSGWADVDLAEETTRLLDGLPEPEEQVAATEVFTLLQSMRDLCATSKRRLVVYASEGEEAGLPIDHPGLLVFNAAFPEVDEHA